MTLLLLLGAAKSRVVAQQPTSLAELDSRPLHAWWNGDTALVEVADGDGFRVVSQEAVSGLELPWTSTVRVDGERLQPVTGLDPSGVARLFAPDALPGREVSDIFSTPEGAWAALLDGGLVHLDKDSLAVKSYGRAEGLPSGQVNAVAVYQDAVHVGTASGLFRLSDGQVWDEDEGLADRWVQALYPHEDGLYVGTYKGLSLFTGSFRRMLAPLSVFWVGEGGDERRWAGYNGLQGLPAGEAIEGVSADLNVWDVDVQPGQRWLATDSEGLLLLREGVLTPVWSPPSQAVYALHRVGPTLYVAADDGGLVSFVGREPTRRWGRADGLPGDIVYEVEGGPPGKLWVGTDDGLALMWPRQDVVVPWPRSPVAAGVPGLDVLADKTWAMAATDEGVATLGRIPRGWRDVEALPGPIVGLEANGHDLWVVGSHDLWHLRRGRLRHVPLPIEATEAALVGGNLWIGSAEGLHRYDGGLDRVVRGPRCDEVLAMTRDNEGRLWVVTPHRVLSVTRNGDSRDYLTASPSRDVAAVRGMVYLATRNGLEQLDPSTGDVQTVAGFETPALAVEAEGGMIWVMDEDLWVRSAPTGLPRPGVPDLWTLGQVRGLHLDGHGRLWAMGERGFALL